MRQRVRKALRAVLASYTPSKPQSASLTTSSEIEGVIQHVDPVNRELPILVNGVSMSFYVPFHCTISANDEAIAMPLLRAQDRARLSYSVEHGVPTAHIITVTAE